MRLHRQMALDRSRQPAAVAAARVARAGALLGALGLASAAFVVSRLVEAWRIAPASASHEISIIGDRLSYPAANLAAVVVLVLALVGLVVTVQAVAAAVGEVLDSRRFARALRAQKPRPLRDAWLIADERPRAFCAGLIRPTVYVSSGAVALLDEAALGAVLAHERHHARRRDPLRLAAGRVCARALFFVPGLRELLRRQQSLAELSADESAIAAAPENRAALAQAMLKLRRGVRRRPGRRHRSRPGRPAGGRAFELALPDVPVRGGRRAARAAGGGRGARRTSRGGLDHARPAAALEQAVRGRAGRDPRRDWAGGAPPAPARGLGGPARRRQSEDETAAAIYYAS